jgi:hypothetical protein
LLEDGDVSKADKYGIPRFGPRNFTTADGHLP